MKAENIIFRIFGVILYFYSIVQYNLVIWFCNTYFILGLNLPNNCLIAEQFSTYRLTHCSKNILFGKERGCGKFSPSKNGLQKEIILYFKRLTFFLLEYTQKKKFERLKKKCLKFHVKFFICFFCCMFLLFCL